MNCLSVICVVLEFSHWTIFWCLQLALLEPLTCEHTCSLLETERAKRVSDA